MDDDLKQIGCSVIIVLAVFALAIGFRWYSSDTKQHAWARQGCNLTTWEIFWGATPVERVMLPPPPAQEKKE